MAFDSAFHCCSGLIGIDGAVVAVVELEPGFTWQLRALHYGAVIGQVVDAPIAVIQVFATADAEIHKTLPPNLCDRGLACAVNTMAIRWKQPLRLRHPACQEFAGHFLYHFEKTTVGPIAIGHIVQLFSC